MEGPFRFHRGDLLAGIGVAFVLIPQSLAYAELAGLPAHRGLYVAAFAPIAAAFLASSPWLQTGPVALTSLLTLGALIPLAEMGSPEYVALASLLALVVGGARAFIGLFRLGWMAFLLSQPVIVGFTSAAAILIIGSQLPGAVGVDPEAVSVGARALWALGHPLSWEPSAVAISLVTVAIMVGSRRIHPAVPGVLLACLAGIAISLLAGYQGAVVGPVPGDLPRPSLNLPWLRLPSLILPGIVIAMVGFAEAASVSQALATKERMSWDPDREFLSQGAANLAAGLFGGFPAGGSLSRTSLIHLAGARTRWAGLIAGVTVLLFLPFSSAFAPLPKATLSAVVIAAVWKLIKFSPLMELWRLSRPQALVGWTAFVFTLVLAPHVEEAVILSVALALGLHLWRELSPGHSVSQEDGLLTLELRGVLWFGSAPILEEALLGSLEAARDIQRVRVDLQGLGRIDVTGALVLKKLREDVRRAGLEIEFTRVPTHAHRVLKEVLNWSVRETPGTRGVAGRAESPSGADDGGSRTSAELD
jgi:SulP family sulfate permease